jgi:hypothetical protein
MLSLKQYISETENKMAASIKKKLLTPSKFGLNTMKPMTSSQIVTVARKRLMSLDISDYTKQLCNYIIDQSIAGKDSFPAKFSGVSNEDLGVITSDFGEVAGAIYMLNSKMGYTHARFPIGENERLVDYYLVRNGIDEKISAKAGQGGAPALTAVEKALGDIDTKILNDTQKKALSVLDFINKGTVYGGVLEAAKFLKMPGYKALISILSRKDLKTGYNAPNIPDQQDLIRAVDACGTFDSCMSEFKPLFTAANFVLGGEGKMRSVFDGSAGSRYKKWGILHFPVTSEIMGWLNDPDNEARNLLTMAARTLTVSQVYFDYKSNNFSYTTKTFSDADFKFHSPSSTPNPVGNRIGMKMIKSMKKE